MSIRDGPHRHHAGCMAHLIAQAQHAILLAEWEIDSAASELSCVRQRTLNLTQIMPEQPGACMIQLAGPRAADVVHRAPIYACAGAGAVVPFSVLTAPAQGAEMAIKLPTCARTHSEGCFAMKYSATRAPWECATSVASLPLLVSTACSMSCFRSA